MNWEEYDYSDFEYAANHGWSHAPEVHERGVLGNRTEISGDVLMADYATNLEEQLEETQRQVAEYSCAAQMWKHNHDREAESRSRVEAQRNELDAVLMCRERRIRQLRRILLALGAYATVATLALWWWAA